MPYIGRTHSSRAPKMATTLLITAKGQVTLRKELLRHLGVAAGDKVAVDFLPDGRVELWAAKPEGSIQKFIGSLQRPGTEALSIDEISEAAARGWAGRR
jgi:antitoxin PrlF